MTIQTTTPPSRDLGPDESGLKTRKLDFKKWSLSGRALPFVTTPVAAALFLAIWELLVRVTGVSPYVLPPPSAIGHAFVTALSDQYVWTVGVIPTFLETVIGFLVALVIGVLLGFLMGRSPFIQSLLNPFVIATQVIPKVALIPLFILWFGFGAEPKIVVSALLAFFPILVNTSFGVRSVPMPMRYMLQTVNAGRIKSVWKVYLPYALPNILTGCQIGILQAFIGAIVGEYLTGTRGLGAIVIMQQNALAVPEMFATILIMAMVGFVFYGSIIAVRKILVPWHSAS